MITQELLKEHFEYRDGHLWWIKPTTNSIKVGQIFGCLDSERQLWPMMQKLKRNMGNMRG